jgi:hypothetical protein
VTPEGTVQLVESVDVFDVGLKMTRHKDPLVLVVTPVVFPTADTQFPEPIETPCAGEMEVNKEATRKAVSTVARRCIQPFMNPSYPKLISRRAGRRASVLLPDG